MNNTDLILNQIGQQSIQSLNDALVEEYNKEMEPYVIDPDGEYPDPDYLIEIGDVPTMPKGNLVAITAKWKNGKTFFCDILSAILLGYDQFGNCRSLVENGRVLFFDTEQAKSDTARIRKIIDAMPPESRHKDLKVFCLRNADIYTNDNSKDTSRLDLIQNGIVHEHPALVIIDGIADLIYNYNDVIESQEIVNKLAALSNEHNCVIVVVMHQNKSSHDKNMKGHLGTLLYQKCSDIFFVEKCGSIFSVTHDKSRHRLSDGLAFKLDAKAVPMDAAADRQLQLELERQQVEKKLKEKRDLLKSEMERYFENPTAAKSKSAIADAIQAIKGVSRSTSFRKVDEAIDHGILKTNDNQHYFISSE